MLSFVKICPSESRVLPCE